MANKKIVLEEFKNKYADVFFLIYFTDDCNYDCEYCYNRRPYTKEKINIDKLFNFIKKISEITNSKLAIEIIGGEPTLHPQLTEFLTKIQKLNVVDICIFTNFSRDINFYMNLIDNFNVRFLATWHSTKIDNQNTQFLNKILSINKRYLSKTNLVGFKSLFIRIMLEWQQFDFCCQLYKKILSLYPDNIDISLVADPLKTAKMNNVDENNTNYTEAQKYMYKKLYSMCKESQEKQYRVIFDDKSVQHFSFGDMFLNKLFSYYLFKCDAGKSYFYIHSNGNVYPCQSYYELNQKPIFNIAKSTNEFIPLKFTICKSKICSCDFGIRKERIFS